MNLRDYRKKQSFVDWVKKNLLNLPKAMKGRKGHRIRESKDMKSIKTVYISINTTY